MISYAKNEKSSTETCFQETMSVILNDFSMKTKMNYEMPFSSSLPLNLTSLRSVTFDVWLGKENGRNLTDDF